MHHITRVGTTTTNYLKTFWLTDKPLSLILIQLEQKISNFFSLQEKKSATSTRVDDPPATEEAEPLPAGRPGLSCVTPSGARFVLASRARETQLVNRLRMEAQTISIALTWWSAHHFFVRKKRINKWRKNNKKLGHYQSVWSWAKWYFHDWLPTTAFSRRRAYRRRCTGKTTTSRPFFSLTGHVRLFWWNWDSKVFPILVLSLFTLFSLKKEYNIPSI